MNAISMPQGSALALSQWNPYYNVLVLGKIVVGAGNCSQLVCFCMAIFSFPFAFTDTDAGRVLLLPLFLTAAATTQFVHVCYWFIHGHSCTDQVWQRYTGWATMYRSSQCTGIFGSGASMLPGWSTSATIQMYILRVAWWASY